jgi:hypothetical protein
VAVAGEIKQSYLTFASEQVSHRIFEFCPRDGRPGIATRDKLNREID